MSRVLVVDDERDVVEALARTLSRRGYEVEAAGTGEEGIEKTKKSKFDVALLDINLPGLNGIQTLEQIKSLSPETEVIMITGYGSIETATESLKKGAYDYIQKPVSSDKILVVIEKALEKHQLTETVALYEISKAIFSTIDMPDLLKIIVELAMKVLRADDVSIMLFDEQNKLYIAFANGLNEEVVKETRLELGERIAGWVAQNRQAVILINGLTNDERFKGIRGREDIKSSIVIPLVKGKDVLGIIAVNRLSIAENFSQMDLYKSNIFASMVSLGLDNANLYKNLQKLQLDLLRAYQDLERNEKQALATLTELKDANEKLKTHQQQLSQSAKLAALGKLVSDMAHEVNNPLMIISGSAQLCLMDGIPQEEIKNHLKIIFNECRKSKDIIQRLLRFSRPSRGQLKEKDINTSIESIVSIIEHQFSIAGVKIKRNYCQNIEPILIDEEQLQEVFMNLLNNAKDAMVNGGEITISTSCADRSVRIDFSDTGCGMPEEVIKHIFEPFFTTKEKGNGLGLSVCYGIVKVHEGELIFDSKLGQGTTASILLPLKEKVYA
jgi:signal transduction histidine kinase/ActR/RegA family two-component response regulator